MAFTRAAPLPGLRTGREMAVIMGGMGDGPRLRAFTEADLGFLDRLDADPDALGPFEWFGFRDPRTRRRRWESDRFSARNRAPWPSS